MRVLSASLLLCFLMISCTEHGVDDCNCNQIDPQPTCGNGQIDEGEACDGNLHKGQTCASFGAGYTGILKCKKDCSDFDTSGCIPPSQPSKCGNHQIDEGEVCDGDLHNGKTCASFGAGYTGILKCKTDCSGFDTSGCIPPSQPSKCGNHQIDEGEACDGDLHKGQTCASFGEGYTGILRCKNDCSDFDTSGCMQPERLPSCGNGRIDEGELCDGNLIRDDLHYNCHSIFGPGSTGELKCAESCFSFDKSACTPPLTCGDGRIQINEQCDTENTDESRTKCSAYYGEDFEGLRACTTMCRWDLAPCVVPDHCGNGRLDADLGEECDPSAPQSYDKTCADLRGAGSKGSVYCNNMCRYSLSGCSISPACGNGQTDNGTGDRPAYHEVCDTTDLKGKSCASLGSGYTGQLGCLVNCSGFDYSDCKAPDA